MNNDCISSNALVNKEYFESEYAIVQNHFHFSIEHTTYSMGDSAYRIQLYDAVKEIHYCISYEELIEAILGIDSNKTIKGALKQATEQLLELQEQIKESLADKEWTPSRA